MNIDNNVIYDLETPKMFVNVYKSHYRCFIYLNTFF